MGVAELLSRTTIANVVSGAVIIAAVIYSVITKDSELIKSLALVGAGWLFGVTRVGRNG